ncbi:hypothetical protein ACFW04_011706 [Cataglyphis niger]
MAQRIIVLAYPLPERLYCPRCRKGASNGSVGSFSDQAHLIRHMKKHHPGDNVTYKCSACDYRGTGKVPLRTVINHFKKEHAEPPREEPGRPVTSRTQTLINVIGGLVCARTRAPGALSSAAACTGVSPRPPTSSTATATPPPGATPPAERSTRTTASRTAGESPTYAAITAAGPLTRTSSSAAPLSAVHRGTAATTGKARHIQDGESLYREDGAANRKRPFPVAREARIGPLGGPHGSSTSTRRTSATTPTTTTEGDTILTSMRRSISAPLVKSGVVRRCACPPRRSPNTISPSFGGLEGSGRRTPERTLPTTSQGRPVTRSRATRPSSVPAKKYATKPVPLARTTARGVLRGPPTTGRKDHGAQPDIPSCAGTAARDLLAALMPRSTPGEAVGPVRTLALQRGSPPLRMTPPTPTSIYGVVPGVTATPPLVPAASGSATLTTCTVTVTTCRGPVMSTGFLAGRSATPPARSSPLPTIREVSPCEERRPEGGAAPRTPPTPSSGEEGDSGGPWRTVGRRARSRWSGDSSEGDSPPPAGLHRTPGHSPQVPANTDLAQRMRPCTVVLERSLVRSIREVSASIPQPRTSEDGATGERSGRDNAGHKSVQVSLRSDGSSAV